MHIWTYWDRYLFKSNSSDVGAGSGSFVGALEFRVWVSVDSLNNGELKISVSHWESLGSLDFLALKGNSSDNLDCIRLSSVVTSHFLVELRDSTVEGGISEFLVHVVDGSSGLILKNDSVSLNRANALLEDLINWKDSALWSLDLLELSHVVPLLIKSHPKYFIRPR
jgi:hypothetical protein